MTKTQINKISDNQMNQYIVAENGKITKRQWNNIEESNAGTIIVLDKSARWAAGTWIANGRGGWTRDNGIDVIELTAVAN